MATHHGDGIVRTESGRQTYTADGPSTSDPTSSNAQRASQASDSSTIGEKDASDGEKNRNDSNGNEDVEKQSEDKKKDEGEGEDEEKDPNVVDWDGDDDPQNPYNFKPVRKWLIAVCMGLMTFVCTFASSVLSSAVMPISMEYGPGTVVAILSTSLFVLGFAFGPIVWGPFSELYGRKPPLFIGYFIFGLFQIPVAVAQNLETIMICRFFGGFFASAPLAVVGGALADFFDPIDRGVAMSIFGASTFIGPTMGPILGGFITMSYLGWRWTQWITLILIALFGTIGFIVIPETYAPVLLQKKAKSLRYETKNWAIRAPADEKKVDFKEIVEKYLLRPFKMLAMEPILVLITIYMSLIYGIIYGFFEAFPVSFQDERGWNLGVGALPFLSVLVGVIIACLIISFITKRRIARVMEEVGHVVPEERLIPMMIGGVVLPVGMFWFGWTSSPSITPWPQIIAAAPIGTGVMLIFLQGLNYIIDVYKINANSAIAANTFFRSWVGAAFPLFSTQMFINLGVPWAMSLLAFLCIALFPAPILFYIYGEKIRKMSRYSPD
ncbi:Citrinin biosynthesis cluster MFS transporter mrr1 [Fulvia fulva]|uniref:Cercosporin MFS transporter CTB4 n=1 Tax=Passalora fulva TaxID=5499 RepID=A0A9Q8LIX3_PASFU|nr:Citrinin biosynthesis cluster MFS transporter mrr1 [Fulvia fulva]KAK4623692.1 Citrinin biosynthesis cluster MFS transporter mrr1 [Fulvia fulva]UJO18337.1 Citrinin biosynthesis cluster MFS transporter mrr1 [Fulvia fulva]WPV14905.1 Citrinin biosynthesis cluster MFS transporter mrr1 [Fulvia fulva]WPV29844.1 Citrinin biosynthesis cluster MFS transporter mrr1 [Fulvia fulva]